MYRNFILAGFKDSFPLPILARINYIPIGIEVIVVNRTDLFRNISTLSLHGKIDVDCHLLKD